MSSKWNVAGADDMTRESEFAQILATAEIFKLHLRQFERDLSYHPLITARLSERTSFSKSSASRPSERSTS